MKVFLDPYYLLSLWVIMSHFMVTFCVYICYKTSRGPFTHHIYFFRSKNYFLMFYLNTLYVFKTFVFNSSKPFNERKSNRMLLLVRNTRPSESLKTQILTHF